MEQINRLIGGMNLDVHPTKQPDNVTTEVQNMVLSSDKGNILSLSAEKGTTLNTTLPAGFKIMGRETLNDEELVILVNPAGNVSVGAIKNGVYTAYAPVDSTGTPVYNNTEFGFSQDFPIDVKARKLINGHRVLYYTDNNVPFGYIDLDSPPVVGTVSSTSSLVPTQKIPFIDLLEVKENVQGTLKATTYFFITRYKTSTGGYTTFGIPSNGIPITSSLLGGDVTQYMGVDYSVTDTTTTPATTTETTISKNIVLKLSNIDIQYAELQVVACWYDQTGVLQASVADNLIISGRDTIQYTFTGITSESVAITKDELQKVTTSYQYAKCIEQKDNVLFLSNLRANDTPDIDLQNIANTMQVTYEVEEIPYSNREPVGYVPAINGFTVNSIVRTNLTELTLKFSQSISSTQNVANFFLYQPYKVASATLTVTSFTSTGSITLQTGSVGDVTLSAVLGTPSAVTEFQATGSNAQTAINLAACINNNCPNYLAYIDSGTPTVVTLLWRGNPTGYGNGKVLDVTLAAWITKSGNMAGGAALPNPWYNPISYTVTGNTLVLQFDPAIYNYIATGYNLAILAVPNAALSAIYTSGIDQTNTVIKLNITDSLSSPNSSTSGINYATDFINPVTCFYKKGYRRDEVYSFGFYLLFKDGSKSMVYHIPGNDKVVTTPGKNPANTVSKQLGTYVSNLTYPLNQGYPTGSIRHHVIPSLSQEPHYRVDVLGNAYIRTLGVKFTSTVPLPASLVSKVAEVVFVRELRDAPEKTSILSQGLLTNTVISANMFDTTSRKSPQNANGWVDSSNGYHLQTIPFCNRLRSARIHKTQDGNTTFNTHSRSRGVAYPGYLMDVDTNTAVSWSDINNSFTESLFQTYDSFKKLNTDIQEDQVVFYSPESQLLSQYSLSSNQVIGASFKRVLKMTGNLKPIAQSFESWDAEINHALYTAKRELYQSRYMYLDVFTNFKGVTNIADNTKYVIQDANIIKGGSATKSRSLYVTPPSATSTYGINSLWSVGGLHCRLDNPIQLADGTASEIQYIDQQYSVDIAPDTLFTSSNKHGIRLSYFKYLTDPKGLQYLQPRDIVEYLYNLETNLISQYGSVSDGSYVPIYRHVLSNSMISTDTVFSGDTYITKYAYNGGQVIYKAPLKQYKEDFDSAPYGQNVESSIHDRTTLHYGYSEAYPPRLNTAVNPSIQLPDGDSYKPAGQANGTMCKEVVYYFVESSINTYYRHAPVTEVQNSQKNYFPYEKSISNLFYNWPIYRDQVTNYNGLYSYEPKISLNYVRGSTQQFVTKFENRTIWSEKAASDSVVDSYRSFLVENYYDLPANTGPIWDSFVYNNTLYLHTPKCLWVTFAEPAAMLTATNLSDVVLGTGNLFSRPSMPVVTSNGGYGGTMSQFAGILTPIGYIFPDILQGKIFCLTNQLEEVSAQGMYNYFRSNMNSISDNPFNSKGMWGVMDYANMRFIIGSNDPVNKFTLSYSLFNKRWTAFHTYYPEVAYALDKTVYLGLSNTVHILGTGVRGNYFGTQNSSNLSFICRGNNTSVYNNLVIRSYSMNTVDSRVMRDTFNTIKAYNKSRNTSTWTLQIVNSEADVITNPKTIAVKFRNDHFRLAVPRNVVKNPLQDLNSVANQWQPTDDDFYYLPRMKGEYLKIELGYSNLSDYDFVVNEVCCIFDENIR